MTRLSAERLVAGHRDGRRRIPIVGPVDLTVDAGQLTVVMGPNGAGKTTLLRALSGITAPLEGRIVVGATPLVDLRRDQRARTIAVVLTDHPDVGLLKVRDVVGIGRHPHTGWSGRLDAHDDAVVAETMAAVGVSHLADRHLGQLSDGQRQRVWIARAMAQEPEVLLLDEPTAFLDLPGRVETVALLRRLAVERDLAVVASIHDLDLALRIADRVWLLDADGGLLAGAPEDLALSGAIDAAFGRDDVRFDLTTASFSTPVACCAEVAVTGLDDDPVRRLWTERALTRAGAMLVEGAAPLRVSATTAGWTVTGADGEVAVTTLEALVATVRDATAGAGAAGAGADGPGAAALAADRRAADGLVGGAVPGP